MQTIWDCQITGGGGEKPFIPSRPQLSVLEFPLHWSSFLVISENKNKRVGSRPVFQGSTLKSWKYLSFLFTLVFVIHS